MSENETQPTQATESADAPLAENELEQVAGGETVIDGVIETIKRWTEILT
jgi:hypothetical protein